MFMTLGIFFRKVTWKGLLNSWIVSFFSNFAGAVFGAYFFGYITDLFVDEPWLTNIQNLAVKKNSMEFQVVFFRAIAANFLVNMAIFVGVIAEDVAGKILSTFIIIGTFATPGFEHSIANMFFVTHGLMYGAKTTFGEFIYKNLIPVTLGNIVGGMIVGISLWYIYGTKQKIDRKEPELFTISCLI